MATLLVLFALAALSLLQLVNGFHHDLRPFAPRHAVAWLKSSPAAGLANVKALEPGISNGSIPLSPVFPSLRFSGSILARQEMCKPGYCK
jgi:hypothetical protein